MVNLHPLIVLAIGCTVAVLFFFARNLGQRPRTLLFVVSSTVLLGCPIVLAADSAILRCLIAFLHVVLFQHMLDLHIDPYRAIRLSCRAYLITLFNFCWSVARASDDGGGDLTFRKRIADTVESTVIFCLVTVIAVLLFKVNWRMYPFLLEHTVKSISLLVWLLWAFNTNVAVWRVAGAPAMSFTNKSVFLSYSPAEFWRRIDRPQYRWFHDNIFMPIGGRRRPVVATMAAFVISAILHEYLLAVTIDGITGYVFLFFILHGVATLLTRSYKPSHTLLCPAIVLTFLFNISSTVLILAPINRLYPIYANDVPRWVYLW